MQEDRKQVLQKTETRVSPVFEAQSIPLPFTRAVGRTKRFQMRGRRSVWTCPSMLEHVFFPQ